MALGSPGPKLGRMRSLRPLVPILAIAFLAVSAGPAHASGCSATFYPATHVVEIGSCVNDSDAPTFATISRTSNGAILLDGKPIAGAPTVTNTDQIVYHGDATDTDKVTLDMSNGLFVPGYTKEAAGASEIEFSIDGGSGATNFLTILGDATETDWVDISASGIDFGGDDDGDLTSINLGGKLSFYGQGGVDRLAAAGYPGVGPSTAPVELHGGAGDDSLMGGQASDQLDGGAGNDVVNEAGTGLLLTDTSLAGNGQDTLESVERATLSGSSGPDVFNASAFSGKVIMFGLAGDDTLWGGHGDDFIDGHAGDDDIDGGPGFDSIQANAIGDTVLTDTSYDGFGTDSLASVERATIHGTPEDQTIDASAFSGATQILGDAGADTLLGGSGADTLAGGEGADKLVGGAGKDAYSAGAGDDEVFSSDGVAEQVECGEGADVAVADQLDGVPGCEQVNRGEAAPEPPPVGGATSAGADPGPPVDATAPVVSHLAATRRALRLTLSEPASVRVRIERAGRVRTITRAGVAGENRFPFARRLRPGRYRIAVRATDLAGNASAVRRLRLRVR